MRVDGRQEEEAKPSAVFPVAPVRPRSAVPRIVAVAIAVGALAFMAGLQVGAGGTAEPARSGVPQPASSPAATPRPAAAPPGSSAFVRDFDPAEVIAGLAGGTGCVTSSSQKEVPRTRRDGSRSTFVRSWMTYCPLEVGGRQAFLLDVIDGLVRRVPSETHGYATAVRGSGDALFPYAERPFVGTVTLTADAAGPGFEIVIVLEERLVE
jgi:hypothetical protein